LNRTLNKNIFVTVKIGLIDKLKIRLKIVNNWLKNILLSQIDSKLSFVSKSVQHFGSSLSWNCLSFSTNPGQKVSADAFNFLIVNGKLNVGL